MDQPLSHSKSSTFGSTAEPNDAVAASDQQPAPYLPFSDARPKTPFYQQLFSSHYAVTGTDSSLLLLGPNGYENSSLHSQERRMSLLNLRPSRLIGEYRPLCTWLDRYQHADGITSTTQKFYDDQNELIRRLQEIDTFLDAGRVHYNMLSNYGESGKLATVDEESLPGHVTDPITSPVAHKDGRLSRFHDHPGNIDNGAQFLGYNEHDNSSAVLVAILVNFFLNFVLLLGKIVVSLLTSSMSVIASLVDSVLDFLSTFIIYIANRLTAKKNWKIQHSYPVGRTRLEPLGVLVFSVIMIITFFQVGQESLKRLLGGSEEPVRIGKDAIGIMLITIITKIGAWVWCSSSTSSSVQALAQDAMTDIVFNTVSLLMPTLGYYLHVWWLDPLGALLLSGYVIVSWCWTAYEHIDNLTGAAASQVDYKVILYLAYRFAESIKQITALKVYHVGDHYNVEIDVVFAYEEFRLSFKDCHDIAEALQYAIETLPMVERAFVHIDYMEGNYKGHLR